MNTRRALLSRIAGAACLALAATLPIATSQAADLIEGRDYSRLSPPQATDTPGKIAVVEFFSWACPHCYEMHPKLSAWKAKLPDNAVFVPVPVAFGRRDWGVLVRTYFTLEATGDLARLNDALFRAIHKDGMHFEDEASITAWATKNGVDGAKFTASYNSFNVSTKSSRAEQLSRSYRISGVPALAVDGKYLVLGRTHDESLSIARQLIDKAAAEKKLQGTSD